MTYSTKLGVDVSENLTLNCGRPLHRRDAAVHRRHFDPVTFASFPAAAQSTQTVHQLFTRGEAVWSLFDGRIKNYFGVNYTNHWNYNISPGDSAADDHHRRPHQVRLARRRPSWRRDHTLSSARSSRPNALQTVDRVGQNVNKAGYHRVAIAIREPPVPGREYPPGRQRPIRRAYDLPAGAGVDRAGHGNQAESELRHRLQGADAESAVSSDFPAFIFFANPNLKPEESPGYDAGFEQPLFNDRVALWLDLLPQRHHEPDPDVSMP